MKLFCGSDLSEQTSDTLYQFVEGKKAHTIKFIPYQSEKNKNINSLNNNKVKYPPDKKIIKINNELILSKEKNKNLKDNNKISNEISELEIIDYPIDEIKKNDYKINTDMIRAKTNINNFNDKCQNNIVNYLKCKPGNKQINFLLDDDDYSSLNSNSEDKYNIKDDSSKSDEIICSYVEIDNSKALVKRAQKENNKKYFENFFTNS